LVLTLFFIGRMDGWINHGKKVEDKGAWEKAMVTKHISGELDYRYPLQP